MGVAFQQRHAAPEKHAPLIEIGLASVAPGASDAELAK
jgi:hypothetical protein